MSSRAWETYAADQAAPRATNSRGERTWWNWTQYPDHGPGMEVLGTPKTLLDLGCGRGRNVAHAATQGIHAVGVDFSLWQIGKAQDQWADVNGATFRHRDVVDYLADAASIGKRFDAVTSVFGAVWFTDPDTLLPLVRAVLNPGGVLAFSHEPPIEGCYGCQGSYIRPADGKRAGKPHVLRRWAYDVWQWPEILEGHGFVLTQGGNIAPPDPDEIPTMLIHTYAPA